MQKQNRRYAPVAKMRSGSGSGSAIGSACGSGRGRGSGSGSGSGLLGRSWADLGRQRPHLGPILGPFGRDLGACRCGFGVVLS